MGHLAAVGACTAGSRRSSPTDRLEPDEQRAVPGPVERPRRRRAERRRASRAAPRSARQALQQPSDARRGPERRQRGPLGRAAEAGRAPSAGATAAASSASSSASRSRARSPARPADRPIDVRRQVGQQQARGGRSRGQATEAGSLIAPPSPQGERLVDVTVGDDDRSRRGRRRSVATLSTRFQPRPLRPRLSWPAISVASAAGIEADELDRSRARSSRRSIRPSPSRSRCRSRASSTRAATDAESSPPSPASAAAEGCSTARAMSKRSASAPLNRVS